MKLKLVKCLMALLTMTAAQASADEQIPSIRWTQNSEIIRITSVDITNATVPPLGYVLDLSKKENLCYEGKDFEAVDLIYTGLNRHGVELCDSYIIVTGKGDIVVGPCQQPGLHEEFYSVRIPACAQ